MKPVRALLRNLLLAPLALLLVFEQWGWETLARALTALAKLPLWARLERRVQRLPPWGALLLLAVPALALFPVKLLALVLFGSGHALLGVVLLVGAKLFGTAVVARLFQLTQPALMQYGWFARLYPRWKDWKDGLILWIQASKVWRLARIIKARVRAWWKTTRRK